MYAHGYSIVEEYVMVDLKEIKTGLECGGTDHEARAEYTVDERT